MRRRLYLQLLPAVGVTLSLGSIGVVSHLHTSSVGAFHHAFNGSLQSAYETQFESENPLRNIAVATVGALRWGVFGQGTSDVVIGADGWLFSAEEFQVAPDFNARLIEFTEEVTQIHDTLQMSGIELLVVAVPDKAEIYSEKLNVARPAAVQSRRHMFVDALRARDINTLDATDALLREKALHHSFQVDDTHWSPEGSRAVAADIAEVLADADIALSKAEVTISQLGTAPHDGDLLAFVTTGIFRPWIGPTQSDISEFETTVKTTATLFEDVTVDVALVGTSFSANPDWHFADFLQEALSTELLNFAKQGRGPIDPMRAMLASESFQTNPPKLVIWEIPVRYTTMDLDL